MSSNALFLGPYGGDYSTTPLTSVRPSAQPLGSNTRRVLQACTSQQLMMLHSSLANSARAATNTPAGEVRGASARSFAGLSAPSERGSS